MAIYRGSRRLSSPRSSHRQKTPWRERREFSRSRRTSVNALIPVSLSRANAVQDFFDVCERNLLKSCLFIATCRREFLPSLQCHMRAMVLIRSDAFVLLDRHTA